MTFGEKLQAQRRKAGLSQDALAERLEVSRQAVSKWERDEAMAETEKVVRIAKVFGVSLDELLLDKTGEDTVQIPRDYVYTDIKRTVKRHGYKLGYVLIVLGILLCVLSLLMWQLWPQIAFSVFRTNHDSGVVNPYEGKAHTIIVGGEERVITEIPEFMIENALREQRTETYEYTMGGIDENALRAQSRLFLIGVIPGGAMTVCGIVIVVKGKKVAAEG